jgi:hypothetical protein
VHGSQRIHPDSCGTETVDLGGLNAAYGPVPRMRVAPEGRAQPGEMMEHLRPRPSTYGNLRSRRSRRPLKKVVCGPAVFSPEFAPGPRMPCSSTDIPQTAESDFAKNADSRKNGDSREMRRRSRSIQFPDVVRGPIGLDRYPIPDRGLIADVTALRAGHVSPVGRLIMTRNRAASRTDFRTLVAAKIRSPWWFGRAV